MADPVEYLAIYCRKPMEIKNAGGDQKEVCTLGWAQWNRNNFEF